MATAAGSRGLLVMLVTTFPSRHLYSSLDVDGPDGDQISLPGCRWRTLVYSVQVIGLFHTAIRECDSGSRFVNPVLFCARFR